MYQITFSDQSMVEINHLDISSQMSLISELSDLLDEDFKKKNGKISNFKRNGKVYYRLRIGELRCYFIISKLNLIVEFILHKNTFSDFVFRSKLPLTNESVLEQDSGFWKYLDSLNKTKEN